MIISVELTDSLGKIEIIVNLKIIAENNEIFKKTMVYENQQYDGKQKPIALLAKDLEI